MYLMRQIGTRGVNGNPILPDFMVFLNWKELPVALVRIRHFPYAALMVVLVPGVLAFVFGWFAFRCRVTGVDLSIITQAMTFALMLAFFRNNFGFGGNNGLTDFKDILGFNIQSPETRGPSSPSRRSPLRSAMRSAARYRLALGKVLVAVRDAESRTRFLGYRVEDYKFLVWTLSARMAGVAGALYVPQVGIINPSEFEPANSIEVVIWVAVGGRGTLIGPIVGAPLRQLRQDLVHLRDAGALLALRPWRPFRRHPVPAEGHRRHVASGWSALRQRREPRPRRASTDERRAAGQPARPGGGGVAPMTETARTRSSISKALRSPSTVSVRSMSCPWSSNPARCARSSARTAPARRR